MLGEISRHVREKFKMFFLTDNLLFNNKVIPVDTGNFSDISTAPEEKTIAYVDGGQAEVFSGGNLSLSFIRIFAQLMQGEKKKGNACYEFYLLTTARYQQGDIWYEGKIFPTKGEPLLRDISIASQDTSIRKGNERGPISMVAGIARRFSELKVASLVQADHFLLDGTLTPTFPGEEYYLQPLGGNAAAVAKTSSLFTTGGNNPVVLLQKLGAQKGCWRYFVDGNTSFVKLHPQARHVFRFEGNIGILPFLLKGSADPLFLGYPYGLVLADRFARVTNQEREALQTRFFYQIGEELLPYLHTRNAHDILDRMG